MGQTGHVPLKAIIPASFLVAGNVLGVGILALPIKLGISGYLPSVFDLVTICLLMLISAFVIAERLPVNQKNFDIPSFFHQELGTFGRWTAIICNLIILYGVLVAYLSGISTMLYALLPLKVSHSLLTVCYFLLASSLIVFGRNVLRRGNTFLLITIFAAFIILVFSGSADFSLEKLTYTDWKFLPIGLPVVVSAFHFHNIIPTAYTCVEHNKKALRVAISIGVFIGLLMNLTWVSVVLGSLPETGAGEMTIMHAFLYNVPATVPMTFLLHSKLFSVAGLLFAILAVTASYVANGAGLFGFIRDMSTNYLRTENRLLVAALSFLPPLFITLIYPHIFLVALDIVGGIGETVLFAILPGVILIKIAKKSRPLRGIGYILTFVGLFIFLYMVGQKLGIITLVPTLIAGS